MWIPASLIHLTTLGVLFVVWMHTAERQVITASATRLNAMLRDPVHRVIVPALMFDYQRQWMQATSPELRVKASGLSESLLNPAL
jgi:hypothetical protein